MEYRCWNLLLCAFGVVACGGSRGTDAPFDGWPSPDAGYRPIVPAGAVASAHTRGEPLVIKGVRGTATAPYVISGVQISSGTGTCIEVHDCEHVVIRANHLSACVCPDAEAEFYNGREGYGILVGNSTGITIEDNVIDGCTMGIGVFSTSHLAVRRNSVHGTQGRNSLRLERVTDARVEANHLLDNGRPETFWAPGHRDIGIHVVRSDYVTVCDNVVVRSTSDGIAISGQIDGGGLTTDISDWRGTSGHIEICNNLLLDNMELGVWLTRCHDLQIHHNTIRTSCFTPGTGIGLSFDVNDSEIYANEVVTCLMPGWMGLGLSHDNRIHDNGHFALDPDDRVAVEPRDNHSDHQIKAGWSGIPYSPSSGNRIEDNAFYVLGGELARVMRAKRELARSTGTATEKGWFVCEIEEGLLDPECVAAQQALGDQGVPRAYLIYEPLMPDPKGFVSTPDHKWSTPASGR